MKHKIFIRISVILFSVFIGEAAVSQQTRMLNLKEAIDLSIKNSKQLKASKARIDVAIAQVKEAEENRLPNFNVSGSYLRLNSANVDLKSNSNNSSGGGSSPKISQALYGIANLSYPIYQGGRIKYGIESAKYLQEATKLDADNDKEAVILNTMNAYTNLYKAGAAINVVRESLGSSRQRDTTFSRLEQNGILARNDLLKAELQTSNIELTLLDAENNWRLANINMDLMLGLPENTELAIDTTIFLQTTTIKNIDEYEQLAIQNRKDVQALSFRKKAAGTAIKSAKTEGYPTIALTGGYIAAYIPNFVTITNAINAGVGIQYNLASLWKTNTRLQQAKAREQEIQANEEQLNDVIRLQINQDYQNYLLSQKRIDVYQKALQQATENFRITKNKYDNSLANVTDLLDADVALTQAKLNVSVSKADAVLAYNKLLHTTGLISSTE
ncbi:MAG: TolC family protein [Chitinophagaceae bacterium]|nr:TolC family protein [Chitinophagaceae bacterium]